MGGWRQFATEHRTLGRAIPVAVTGGVLLLCMGACIGVPCFPTGIKYGLWLEDCPDTDLRLGARVSAQGLLRGEEGWVDLQPYVRFLEGEGPDAWPVEHGIKRGYDVELSLLDDTGEPVEGFEVVEWDRAGTTRRAKVSLPVVPDGDYTLRVHFSSMEEVEVDTNLPLYAPAVAHLATDRPLYKPGQTVLLRSVLLKRTDLTPLEGRPGRWRILAPDGTEMLVEKDRAGAFGVADSSFPLDVRAEVGTWTATWESGDTSDSVRFDVRPFRLPRLTVELEPSASWYGISDRLVVQGTATYTSGAPVSNAPVSATVARVDGRWPPPIAWEEPFETRTDAAGRFTVDLGPVPSDLMEKATLAMSASVTEEAGEVARGSTRLVLSKDDLAVEAVTELGNGLVEGFNNRAYLRVTTPDGRPLRGADIEVSNPWEVQGKPRQARTDEDGVAAIQLDPGAPVTVVIPAPPVRQRPVQVADPYVSSAMELTRSGGLDLAERRAVDTAVRAVARCGDLNVGDASVSVGLRVSAGGAVTRALSGDSPVEQCVSRAMRGVRFPMADERTFTLTWLVPDTKRPYFALSHQEAYGSKASSVIRSINHAALEARRCMEPGQGLGGSEALELHWSLTEGSTAIAVTGVDVRRTAGLSPTARACVGRSFAGLRLDEPARGDALGAAVATLQVPGNAGVMAPQDRTETGYELKVAAATDGAALGQTRIVLPVGYVPPLRMRATPSLASPGDQVVVEMFRGEDFYGEIPEELWLYEGTAKVDEADVDTEARKVTFQIPSDVDGFLHVEYAGARAVVYVKPDDPLEVALSTDRAVYKPGETAVLTVSTTAGGQPSPAGVGLMGVDSTLGQLAPLLGPDDFGRVTVRATADEPAFGAFDPRALVLGQVRGENAAKAAVLRITQLPMDPAGDQAAYGSGSSVHDDEEVLTTSFYRALEQVVVLVRAWETSAPEGETMSPKLMAQLYGQALDGLEAAGEPAVDAFGRELELQVLPHDLLVQLDPRQVVADGTRLPEDIVSWTRYVDEEVRR